MTKDDNQIAVPFTAESVLELEEEVLEEITGGGRTGRILGKLFGGCCRVPQTTETASHAPLQIPQTSEPSVPIAKQVDQTHRVLRQFEETHPHLAGQHEVYVGRDANGALAAQIRRIG
jgi:hypothetical protein